MAENTCKSDVLRGTNKNGPSGACNTISTLDIGNLVRGYDMPDDGNIAARGDSASADNTNSWKSIGKLAREIARKAGAK